MARAHRTVRYVRVNRNPHGKTLNSEELTTLCTLAKGQTGRESLPMLAEDAGENRVHFLEVVAKIERILEFPGGQ